MKKWVNSDDFLNGGLRTPFKNWLRLVFFGDFQTEWIVWVEQGVLYTGLFGCTVQKNTFLKKSMWMIQRGVYTWDYKVFAGFNLGHNEPCRFKKHECVGSVAVSFTMGIIQWTQVEKIKSPNPS